MIRIDTALDHLMQAIACGFRRLDLLRRNPDLRPLGRDRRWRHLIATLNCLERANN